MISSLFLLKHQQITFKGEEEIVGAVGLCYFNSHVWCCVELLDDESFEAHKKWRPQESWERQIYDTSDISMVWKYQLWSRFQRKISLCSVVESRSSAVHLIFSVVCLSFGRADVFQLGLAG